MSKMEYFLLSNKLWMTQKLLEVPWAQRKSGLEMENVLELLEKENVKCH